MVLQVNPIGSRRFRQAFQAVVWHCLVSNPNCKYGRRSGERKARPAVFLAQGACSSFPSSEATDASYAPTTLDYFRIILHAPPALARLKAEGYTLVVVSNQPDVGKASSPL